MSRIAAASPAGRFRFRWPRAWRTPLGIIGTVIAGAWIIVAFTAQWWVPYPPNAQVLPRLQPRGSTRSSGPMATDATSSPA